MASYQYKIWKFLLILRYKRNAKKQAQELNLGQPFEMPRPPKILKRKNKIDEYKIKTSSIYTVYPENLQSAKIIFYLHGGAYFTRITLPHWLFIRKLANRFGMKVVIPDYPTAPGYNYLDTYNVVIEAYKRLLENHKPEDIYFMGDSAGGGLALVLSQGIKKESLPQPAALFLLSPWLDTSMTNPDIDKIRNLDYMLSLENLLIAAELYAEKEDLQDPEISPIYGDLEGLPPIMIFIGTHDILLPDCQKLHSLLVSAGSKNEYYEYPDMVHCWMLFPIPEAEDVIRIIQNHIGVLSKQH